MKQYFRSAVEQFVEMTGQKLRPVAFRHAPRLSQEETARLTAIRGEFADNAARLLMKLM